MTKAAVRKLVLDDFLPYRLSVTTNAVSKLIASSYARKFDLSIPEWRLIAVLHHDESATQQELVARTMMDKVAVSRAAQSLQERGLIRREEDSADARAVRNALTRAGRALFEEIEPAALAYEQEILAGLSKAEIRQLHDLLKRVFDTALGVNAKGLSV